MKENSIERDIHLLESYAGMTHKMTDNQGRPKLDQAIEHILQDYKRVLKENEILKEEKEQAWEEWNNLEQESYETEQKLKQQIKELLKAYKELKEIEESHRKENGELREKVKQLEEENKTLNERNQYLVKYRAKLEKELYESNENYIPVSLVEEKIEELIKEGRHYNANKIEVLQELLEKRK